MSKAEAWVNLVVDTLPQEERQVIDRLFYERLSEEATAADLGLTRKRVRTVRRHAFAHMRAAIEALV